MDSVKQDVLNRKVYSIETLAGKPGEMHVRITGRVALNTVKDFAAEFNPFLDPDLRRIDMDLSGIEYLDTSGALELLRIRRDAESRAVRFQFSGMVPPMQRMMDLLVRGGLRDRPVSGGTHAVTASSMMEEIRAALGRTVRNLSDFISFTGEVALAAVYSLAHPRSLRWEDLFSNIKRVGVDGLPIVGMISFLLGLIMAFMSSIQLKQFGAHIYVASLVAIAMVRELGPVMTAILVAGRSGSAFAAEIGTMRVNEEISALVTMGFDTTRFLVIPKVFATLVVLPVLTLYADLFAMVGGMLVGILGLNLTAGTYLQQTQGSLMSFDIASSLVKTLFFAAAIAIVGCQRGLQARGGAQSVGSLTTSAVVSAISFIIIIDSIFAVVLQYIGPQSGRGWG